MKSIHLCQPISVYEISIPASAGVCGCLLFISRYGQVQKKDFVILCVSKIFCMSLLFYIRELYLITRPEGEQHMVLSAPGLYVSFYNSVGDHPQPREAAGDPVTCWFFILLCSPLRYNFRQDVMHACDRQMFPLQGACSLRYMFCARKTHE